MERKVRILRRRKSFNRRPEPSVLPACDMLSGRLLQRSGTAFLKDLTVDRLLLLFSLRPPLSLSLCTRAFVFSSESEMQCLDCEEDHKEWVGICSLINSFSTLGWRLLTLWLSAFHWLQLEKNPRVPYQNYTEVWSSSWQTPLLKSPKSEFRRWIGGTRPRGGGGSIRYLLIQRWVNFRIFSRETLTNIKQLFQVWWCSTAKTGSMVLLWSSIIRKWSFVVTYLE